MQSLPSVISETENKIIEALNSEFINDCSKIIIGEQLKTCIILSGCVGPTIAEFNFAIEFVKSNFKNFKLKELHIAFELYALDKLEVDKHFGNFSPKFIGEVMNAYKKQAVEARRLIKPIDNDVIPTLSEEEIVLFASDMWLNGPRNDFNKVYNANRVFYILVNKGEISPSKEQIEAIIQMVREDNQHRINTMSHLDAKEFSKKCKDLDFFDMQCKKLTLVQYFEKQNENISNNL